MEEARGGHGLVSGGAPERGNSPSDLQMLVVAVTKRVPWRSGWIPNGRVEFFVRHCNPLARPQAECGLVRVVERLKKGGNGRLPEVGVVKLPVDNKMGGQGSKDFKAECSNVLIKHEDTVTCCAFSPNEKLLATCSTDRKVIVWDFRKNREIYVLL